MKKKISFLLLFLSYSAVAQVGVNATGTAPASAAMLDVSSNSKGVLIPRMTTVQKNAIQNPVEGLMVYDTDVKQFSYAIAGGTGGFVYWVNFGNTQVPPTSWNVSGNDLYNSNTGNVGIGNTTPLAKLDVRGDVRFNSQTLNINAGFNNDVDLTTNKSSIYNFGSAAQSGCQIGGFTGGVDGRMITLFNNSPSATVQLYNEFSGSNDINRILTGTGNTAVIYQNGSVSMRYDGGKQRWTILGSNYTDGLSISSGGSGWGLAGNTGTTTANFIGTTDNKSFLIKTNNTTAINVSTDGNVGIGAAPGYAAKLWLSGSDNSIIMYGVNGTYTGSIGTEQGNMLLQSDGDMVLKSALGAPLINRAAKNLILNPPSSNGTNSVGNVGIGTNNPTSKLSVNGSIRAKEIRINSGWADYVFEKKYILRPLAEVEQFIKKNKHLPDIPKASTIQKEGVDVSAIQTKMMAKIEELTLYVIELEKQIKKLEAKNN